MNSLSEAIAALDTGEIHGIITPEVAADMILSSDGKVFSCDFFKKGDRKGKGKNELREFRGRLGSTVKKGLRGGPAAYNPAEHGLIWAYRMAGDTTETDGQRRSIAVSGITRLAIDGRTYHVTGQPHA